MFQEETSARLDRSQQVNMAGVRKTAVENISGTCCRLYLVFGRASPTNLQNDRVYAASGTKKKQLPAERLLRTRSTFSRSVMVSVAVSTLGRTDLFFVDPGTKVNGQYYRDILLRQQLLPAICGLSGNFFTFQQDNAPAHRARETVHLLTHETPDFITAAL